MDVKSEKISVVVPVYNVEKYLDRCVESILQQDYKNIEIILVDDGSTDQSSKKCDTYKSRDNRIIVIHKENGGLGSARNAGIAKASGEYITFIDGDDEILPDHLQNMYDALVASHADTCLCGHIRAYGNKRDAHKNVCADNLFENNEILDNILVKMIGSKPDGTGYIEMSVCMVLFSKQIIDKYQLKFHSEREFISEDLIFDLDYYPHSKRLYVSDDVGYIYYDNEGSLTTKYNPYRFEQQKTMTKEVLRRAKALGIYNVSLQRAYNTFLSITRYSIKLDQKFIKNKKDLKEHIKSICNDEFLQDVFKEFDNSTVPFKSRMVNDMIKNKRINSLILVMSLKNRFGI